MNAFSQLAAIVAFSAAAAGVTWKVSGPPERGPAPCDVAKLRKHEICLEQVKERWKEGILWVDARPRAEWAANGVEGSILWNLDPKEDGLKFEADAMERLAAGPPVVIVYCGSESCGVSEQVAARIRTLGVVEEVHYLHGGAEALAAAGMLGNVRN